MLVSDVIMGMGAMPRIAREMKKKEKEEKKKKRDFKLTFYEG